MIDAVFLDRDGIINEVVMRGDVVGSPRNLEEFKIRDEFSHFYQKIAALELPILVVSNQPDVRRLDDRDHYEKISETRDFLLYT